MWVERGWLADISKKEEAKSIYTRRSLQIETYIYLYYIYLFFQLFISIYWRVVGLRGVVAYVLDCDNLVSEFEL